MDLLHLDLRTSKWQQLCWTDSKLGFNPTWKVSDETFMLERNQAAAKNI